MNDAEGAGTATVSHALWQHLATVGSRQKPKVKSFFDLWLLNSSLTKGREEKRFPLKRPLSPPWAPLRTTAIVYLKIQDRNTCSVSVCEAGWKPRTMFLAPTPAVPRMTDWFRATATHLLGTLRNLFTFWMPQQLLEDCSHLAPLSLHSGTFSGTWLNSLT